MTKALRIVLVGLFIWLGQSHLMAQGSGFDESKFFENENNKKRVLIVGLYEDPPFVIQNRDSYYGLSVDMWEYLAKNANIEYEYKTYKGMLSILRALSKHEVDISINPLIVTRQRLSTFDATQPFFVSSLGVAVSKNTGISATAYLARLLNFELLKNLLIIAASIWITGIAMWLIERRRNTIEFAESPRGILDGVWWAAVTMSTVGYGDKIPKTAVGRVISVVWMLAAVGMLSTFTASLAANLAQRASDFNIQSIEGLGRLRSSAVIATVSGSGSHDYLKAHNLGENLITFDTTLDGLMALRDNKINIFVYDKPIMYYMLTKHKLEQDIEILPVIFNQQYCSFMTPKSSGSELVKRINPEMVDRINTEEWQATLRKYNLEHQ